MELEDELMFDLYVDLEADDMARMGLGTLRSSSHRSKFSPCQARAEAYIGEVDDSIDDTHIQHGLKRHPFAQAQKGYCFEDFLRTLPYSIRHTITKTLVQQFHVETGTFYLSCGEYTVLPLDWMAILGPKFGGHPVPTKFMDFDVVSELLDICYLFTQATRQYFGPIETKGANMIGKVAP